MQQQEEEEDSRRFREPEIDRGPEGDLRPDRRPLHGVEQNGRRRDRQAAQQVDRIIQGEQNGPAGLLKFHLQTDRWC